MAASQPGRCRDWRVARIAVETVELQLALAEVDVHPGRCKLVLARDGVTQCRGRHADLDGQFLDRAGGEQIATALEFREIARSAMDSPEAVFPDEGRIADQIGRNRRNCLVTLEHGFHKIVVGDGLVDKAASGGIHREQSRLGAVEREMREQSLAAVRPRGDRCRRPQAAVPCSFGAIRAPKPFADCDTVAEISLMAERMHGHGLRHEGGAESSCCAHSLRSRAPRLFAP